METNRPGDARLRPFQRNVYEYACPKCDQATGWHTHWIVREPEWARTTAQQNQWYHEYAKRHGRKAPNTTADEWLVLTCMSCGYGFEMRTADSR